MTQALYGQNNNPLDTNAIRETVKELLGLGFCQVIHPEFRKPYADYIVREEFPRG